MLKIKDEKLNDKLDKKLDEKLNDKLDKKLDEQLDDKLDKKLDEQLDETIKPLFSCNGKCDYCIDHKCYDI